MSLNISKILILLLEKEKKIEIQKQILGLITEFEPIKLFETLDKNNKGYISFLDIKLLINEFNLQASDNLIKEIIKYYDIDKDSSLKFNEFLEMIVTNQDIELKNMILKRSSNNNDSKNYFVNREFRKLIELIIDSFQQIHLQIDIIKNSSSFDIDKIISNIDSLGFGYIEKSGLINYMKNYGTYYLTSLDADIMLNRMDIDKDGKVSYNDFESVFYIKNNKDRENMKLSLNFSNTSPNFSNNLALSQNNFNSKYQTTFVKTLEKKKRNINQFNIVYRHLSSFLINLIKIESKLESMKQNIIQKDDICLSDFLFLFPISKGYVTFDEFINSLKNLKILATDYEIKQIFKLYDIDNDNLLNYIELSSIISSNYSELNQSFKENNNLNISTKSHKLLTEFLRFIIEKERMIYKMKKELLTQKIKPLDYFYALKNDICSYLTLNDFKNILVDNDYKETELKSIFNRFDHNRDLKVTLEEFINEIQPYL